MIYRAGAAAGRGREERKKQKRRSSRNRKSFGEEGTLDNKGEALELN